MHVHVCVQVCVHACVCVYTHMFVSLGGPQGLVHARQMPSIELHLQHSQFCLFNPQTYIEFLLCEARQGEVVKLGGLAVMSHPRICSSPRDTPQ